MEINVEEVRHRHGLTPTHCSEAQATEKSRESRNRFKHNQSGYEPFMFFRWCWASGYYPPPWVLEWVHDCIVKYFTLKGGKVGSPRAFARSFQITSTTPGHSPKSLYRSTIDFRRTLASYTRLRLFGFKAHDAAYVTAVEQGIRGTNVSVKQLMKNLTKARKIYPNLQQEVTDKGTPEQEMVRKWLTAISENASSIADSEEISRLINLYC